MSAYWRDKVVLITGGSAGLGLHLARACGKSGAQVTIVARDQERLDIAAEQLRSDEIRVTTYSADVTDRAQVTELATFISRELNGLDVLVNAAGKSTRGLVAETTDEDFQSLWRINFLATVHCSQVLLPMLKHSGGHLVNIGSLASKVAAPYLGAYPASKFAVAAFSQQLRLEMTEPAAHVLLVCPGPIQQDNAGNRYDAQAAGLPPSASQPGGGARVSPIDPSQLAGKIMQACERRKAELIVPGKARWLFALQQLSPRLGDWLLRKIYM